MMNEQTLKLFQTLTELPGAPGNEHFVSKFMKEQLSQYRMKLFKIIWAVFLV